MFHGRVDAETWTTEASNPILKRYMHGLRVRCNSAVKIVLC
jgi:hypothetical protein